VRELEECWRSALAGRPEAVLRVDLTEVTAVDGAGRACLAALHRQGAEFIAADCLTKAVVAEVTGAPEAASPPRAARSPSVDQKRGSQGRPRERGAT
jgi:hypothetical protein